VPDLLLELFSEEIPARMQARAAADLERLIVGRLGEAGLKAEAAKSFATPRRLTLVLTGLPAAQEDRRETRKGPRVDAPEQAIAGFLRSAGLANVDEAEIVEDKKGRFYSAVVEQKGRTTPELVAEIVPDVAAKFPWPKSMRWGDGDFRWVRPLHRVLCTFDGEVVGFRIGEIESGELSEGHRFLAPDVFEARDFDAYATRLAAAKVVLDPEERREIIARGARELARAQGLELREDEGLLAEVAGLAEWPVPRIGSFHERFLSLPDEVLIASMRGHQKYFSVVDPATGRLAPKFVCVANIEPEDGGAAMMKGYERVLEARLSDGWFLYQQDRKTPLAEHAEGLADITFFEGLGTIADKVERMAALARQLAPALGADPDTAETAARLAKADLTTGMVGEFPELQGIMGRYYAVADGLDDAIADAVRDHYKPVGQGDDVPTAPVAVAVALADKLVTLTAFWSIGKKPTGSGDPFALRRMALGVIRIVLENGLRLRLADHLGDDAAHAEDLLGFFHDRLAVHLRDNGYRHDHIRAVLMPEADDFLLVAARLSALRDFLGTEEGANLTAAYKRAGNILKAEAKKEGELPALDVRQDRLVQDEERALHAALEQARAFAAPALAAEDFAAAMSHLAGLRGALDRFFDAVTVNADDPDLRENRLALLQNIIATCDQVADFSALEG
jgi:glycyl-tRNA synthetase beta chain